MPKPCPAPLTPPPAPNDPKNPDAKPEKAAPIFIPDNAVNAGNSISGHECDGAVYLANVPSDPNGSAYYYIPCIGSGEYRCALGQDNATWYEIKYSLEGNSSGLNKGAHIATPSGM